MDSTSTAAVTRESAISAASAWPRGTSTKAMASQTHNESGVPTRTWPAMHAVSNAAASTDAAVSNWMVRRSGGSATRHRSVAPAAPTIATAAAAPANAPLFGW